MAERSFTKEVQRLRLGEGQEFAGEAILAVTKALLQSGVAYVGGYQGAPVSHLMDVLADAADILAELGVRFETSASEATAAAMLAASVNYPLRGAVTWKSTVGTNVASDALSNLASSGVLGGALIVVGEDYGEGASIMQERSHAFAMKSQIWLLDPRPHLPSIVRMVEQGFALSEASNSPVMLMMRIRACHMHGRFIAKDNIPPPFTLRDALNNPARSQERIILPPSTYLQEQRKIEDRWPAALAYIRKAKLNEALPGDLEQLGILVQGGLTNTLLRALAELDLADFHGASRIPILVLNVTYPLLPEEVCAFVQGKKAILIVEEGQPAFIEQAVHQLLRQAGLGAAVVGKDMLPIAGEYTGAVVKAGLEGFMEAWHRAPQAWIPPADRPERIPLQPMEREARLPARPSGLCTGCPERPLFAAMKLVEQEVGALHVSADIGCHSFATMPPFEMGASIMGYGLGAASSAALNAAGGGRPVALMGDGGFWHNGLTSGVGNAVFNRHDGLTIIVDNGYAAATGGQAIPSSSSGRMHQQPGGSIEKAVRGVGVNWVRKVQTYDIAQTQAAVREALTTDYAGPKVIVAEGECQLNKQRRTRPARRKRLQQGKRTVTQRFGVDADVCTGDHSCIRLSGCPSLTIKSNPDPLRSRPVAYVDNSCVGCGVCGGVAHAAVLCPSFHRLDIITHPNLWDRLLAALRTRLIDWLTPRDAQGRVQAARGAVPVAPRAPAPSAATEAAHAHAAMPGAADRKEGRPLTFTLAALGGQGGGVVTSWLVDVAERHNCHVQATSVPGVAQRTGATIYYLEFHPREPGKPPPVMGLMPTPGISDLVVASELLEAARMVDRGIVNRRQTTLITSTHRAYTISEKSASGDGRAQAEDLLRLAGDSAKRLVTLDMAAIAQAEGAVISAAVLGAVAGADVLPFATDAYRTAIRTAGIAVEANLACFEAALATTRAAPALGEAPCQPPPSNSSLLRKRESIVQLPAAPPLLQPLLEHCVERLTDYQDARYAAEFLTRLQPILDLDRQRRKHRLSEATARGMALWMTFEDTIRVGDLKTRRTRRRQLLGEAGVQPGQVMHVTEFLHPRPEEICGTLPRRLGAALMASATLRKLLGMLAKPRKVVTSNLSGHLLLRCVAGLRPLRRGSLRYAEEQTAMAAWLKLIRECAPNNYALACEVAECQQLACGYGDTLARGRRRLEQILAHARQAMRNPRAADQVRTMREETLNGIPRSANAPAEAAPLPAAAG